MQSAKKTSYNKANPVGAKAINYQRQYTYKPRSTLKNLILIAILGSLLTACALKTTYRFMDWLVAWSVDDYVDWQPDQQRQFDRQVDEFLHWHKTTQLIRYADLLSQIKQDVKQPLTPAQLNAYLTRMNQLWLDVLVNVAPRATELLAQLDAQQVANLHQTIETKYAKRHQSYLLGDQADWSEKRLDRTLDNISDFIGRLNGEQKQLIKQWNQALTHSRHDWVAHQQHSAELFHQAMLQRHNSNFGEQINQLMFNQDRLRDADYQAIIEHNTMLTIALTIDLQRSLSTKQQQHLARELDTFIEDFTALAKPRDE